MPVSFYIFTVSFLCVVVFLILKMRALRKNKISMFGEGTLVLDKGVENLSKSVKYFLSLIVEEINHFFDGFVKEKISLIFHTILHMIGRVLSFSHLSYRKYAEKKGAASFFLKDVADHKRQIREKEKKKAL